MRFFVMMLLVVCFTFAPSIWVVADDQAFLSEDVAKSLSQEKFYYTIKQFGLTAGKATLEFKGRQEIQGQEAYLIVFRAQGFNFFDEEKIYADLTNLLPIEVHRDLNIFGKKEKIREVYERGGKVRIIKEVGERTLEQVLESQTRADNIYCFIYRYRSGEISPEQKEFKIVLPTKEVVMRSDKKREISVAGEKYDALYMVSDPKKYQLWFSNNAKRIPLRIDGAVGIGQASMYMTKYEEVEGLDKT